MSLTPINPMSAAELSLRAGIDNSEDLAAFDMIAIGYDRQGSESRNLHFVVSFHNIDNAKRAVRLIDNYNEFDWHKVCTMLNNISKLGHSFGPAGQTSEPMISIGREGSPVMYVAQLCEGAADIVKREAEDTGLADEFDTVSGGGGCSYGDTVRIWWD